jgi:two-component system, NarL family, nitrate/nitrite response regulator NarL
VVTQPDRIKVFVVVEDEPDMRMLISMMLAKDDRLELLGEAASAEEALAVLESLEPGLIVLDHGIEGDIMGLEAAPLLKAKAPNAKILLFTAFDMSREAAAEPAVDGFLRKDRIDQLLPTVLRLLGLNGVDAGR